MLLIVGSLTAVAIALVVVIIVVARQPPSGEARVSDEDDDLEASEDFRATVRSVVVLEDNLWSACTVDGITAEWARFAPDAARGFVGVPAGRHRVVTRTPAGDATLDFTLYPGDRFARRLDAGSATWGEAREHHGDDGLIAYGTTFGVARVQAGARIVVSDDVVAKACADIEALVRGGGGGAAGAAAIGETLVGVPLTRAQLRRLAASLTGADPGLAEAIVPGPDRRDELRVRPSRSIR